MTPALLSGRYRLLDPLGQGGMGIVYEAVQEGLGRHVAVKLLDPRLAEDRVQLERFRREAEIVAALAHPNIVQVTDFHYPDTPDEQPYLVMELLRGESLAARIGRARMPFERVAFIASQVLSALGAAHRAGVVHRDVKPDNVFLLSDAAIPDTVKVLDFGIAKLSGVAEGARLTSTGAMLGTPAFMAPEQARGLEDVDARADLYAVGATMYEALTGRMPHEASSIPALLFAIVEKAPTRLAELCPDIPAELVAVVERAMCKNREDRFADADAMRLALTPWSGLGPSPSLPPADERVTGPRAHSTIATAPTVVATPAVPPQASRPSGLLFLTIMGVAAVAGVVIVTMRNQKEPVAKAPSPDVPQVAEPAVSASVTPSAPPVVSVAPPASAVASASFQAPRRARFAGRRGYMSFTDFGDCAGCDWDTYKTGIQASEPAISACFKASEHDPPLHENVDYTVKVAVDGTITDIALDDPAPAGFDRCLRNVLTSVPLPRTHAKGPGSFRMGFRGECTPGWASHCD